MEAINNLQVKRVLLLQDFYQVFLTLIEPSPVIRKLDR